MENAEWRRRAPASTAAEGKAPILRSSRGLNLMNDMMTRWLVNPQKEEQSSGPIPFLALLSPPSGLVSPSLIDLQICSAEKHGCFLEAASVLHPSRCRLSCSQTVVQPFAFFCLSLDLFFGACSGPYIMVAALGRPMCCSCCQGPSHCVDTEVHIKGADEPSNRRK